MRKRSWVFLVQIPFIARYPSQPHPQYVEYGFFAHWIQAVARSGLQKCFLYFVAACTPSLVPLAGVDIDPVRPLRLFGVLVFLKPTAYPPSDHQRDSASMASAMAARWL